MSYMEILATVGFVGSFVFGVLMIASMREILTHVRQTAYVLTWPEEYGDRGESQIEYSHICNDCTDNNLN